MRLEAIRAAKVNLSDKIQTLPEGDISDQIVDQFRLLLREPPKRRILRVLAGLMLEIQQPYDRWNLGLRLSFPYHLISHGERFANDASRAVLLQLIRGEEIERVLIPGCYLAAEDVQFWLRRGVRRLDGIDVYGLNKRWHQIMPQLRDHYRSEVSFRQASIEELPFPDHSFDLITTSEVLEHVRNLRATVSETARVLRPGGWAWHSFGPLYYTFGGDHCIAAYGATSGYDHLLLDEPTYQARIANQPLFDTLPDPNAPFWARQQQFSFAAATDYLALFNEYFDSRHVLVKISPEGLSFRQTCGINWQRLIEAGLTEEDLLVKSLIVVLQKRNGSRF